MFKLGGNSFPRESVRLHRSWVIRWESGCLEGLMFDVFACRICTQPRIDYFSTGRSYCCLLWRGGGLCCRSVAIRFMTICPLECLSVCLSISWSGSKVSKGLFFGSYCAAGTTCADLWPQAISLPKCNSLDHAEGIPFRPINAQAYLPEKTCIAHHMTPSWFNLSAGRPALRSHFYPTGVWPWLRPHSVNFLLPNVVLSSLSSLLCTSDDNGQLNS